MFRLIFLFGLAALAAACARLALDASTPLRETLRGGAEVHAAPACRHRARTGEAGRPDPGWPRRVERR